MNKAPQFVKIAIPTPLRRSFDYIVLANIPAESLLIGARVKVPFRNKSTIGVIVAHSDKSDIAANKLKTISEVIDNQTQVIPSMMQLCHFASQYYQHPIGEVLFTALPTLLRRGAASTLPTETLWQLNESGINSDPETLSRAPKQAALLKYLQQHPEGINKTELSSAGFTSTHLKSLISKELINCIQQVVAINKKETPKSLPHNLTDEQQVAVDAINKSLENYQCFLLNGITGSGKTEVYLQVIDEVLKQKKSVLVLVPEIGLTPQTIARFQSRFDENVVALHSGLNDQQRLTAWLQAKNNLAPLVIGTRSAIFTPLDNLGLIVVDEEHDLSFKQQDGFRYSARDLAVVRAQIENIPVILGSATPSLESYYNTKQARYTHLKLLTRPQVLKDSQFRVLDLRNQKLQQGLSKELLLAIDKHTAAGNQALLFINRRGYAPTLLCHHCGWFAHCRRCDAHLTFHQIGKQLRCHHCESTERIPSQCPDCHSTQIIPMGQGTERIEQALNEHFPEQGVIRIDRDSTRRKGAMEAIINDIHANKHSILIGTQMIAKGHHFPNVTLVAIVNADGGLYSTDFRATERLSQLVLQVAGRAGRESKAGEVIIQTHNPEHPLLNILLTQGYRKFSDNTLLERKAANLPPYAYFALLRAEAMDARSAMNFLQHVKTLAKSLPTDHITLLGPQPAPMERRAGRYRSQLVLQSNHRKVLQSYCQQLLTLLEKKNAPRNVRWHIDIDPQEMI